MKHFAAALDEQFRIQRLGFVNPLIYPFFCENIFGLLLLDYICNVLELGHNKLINPTRTCRTPFIDKMFNSSFAADH